VPNVHLTRNLALQMARLAWSTLYTAKLRDRGLCNQHQQMTGRDFACYALDT
jgi:hypothetical protein